MTERSESGLAVLPRRYAAGRLRRPSTSAPREPLFRLSRWLFAAAAAFVLSSCTLLLAGCTLGPQPRLGRILAPPPRPLILVPGATGVELLDSRTGQTLWGDGDSLVSPRDRGASLARPLTPPFEDAVVAGKVMREIRLGGVVKKPVYGPWIDSLERSGYRLGDLATPSPEASLYLFAYDWRQDNVDSARRLAAALARLRQAYGGELEVDLVCQSNGAHICRWLAKYGDGTLDQAETGAATPLADVRIAHLTLVGTSNGGSLRILKLMHQGRRYLPVFGRRIAPETVFTFGSLYQDLPVYATDLFVDELGEDVAIDLFEADNWRRFGWSVFERGVTSRSTANEREQQLAFLDLSLDRARRFHHLLAADVDPFPVDRLVLFQSRTLPTDRRALVLRNGKDWRLQFAGDSKVARQSRIERRLITVGDHHATPQSQTWLSEQELARIETGGPILVDGDHFEMILEQSVLERLVEFVRRNRAALDLRR